MRAQQQQATTVQPASTSSEARGLATDWPPLLGIVAFVVVSTLVLGWIGWKKRD